MEISDENIKKAQQLAGELLELVKKTLLVKLRFLSDAVFHFKFEPGDTKTYTTERDIIVFNAEHVLRSYKEERQRPYRDILHIILHYIYLHPFSGSSLDRLRWALSCDVAAENTINELGLDQTSCSREVVQAPLIAELKKELKNLTAQRIYRYLINRDFSDSELMTMRTAFCVDSHENWYMDREDKKAWHGGSGDEEHFWSDTGNRILIELETMTDGAGSALGSLVYTLPELFRKKYNYSAFLRKFAEPGEEMKIDPDEFDTIFYTYGLNMYGNMPLIEPLEYRETRKIRNFIIAIDTSASVSGELVKGFLQKTYDILSDTESFFSKVDIHIIQCDAKIQNDVRITCADDFNEYIKNIKIYGYGGTDFRPVFTYVSELLESGKMARIDGMIYFTDGSGTFPAKMPGYKTAFIFSGGDASAAKIPPWAMKFTVDDGEFLY